MPTPLTLAAWSIRTLMPQADVTDLQAREPGYLDARLASNWSWVKARLAKRYDVAQMEASCPEIALLWLAALTTFDAYTKRGFNPSSADDKAAIVDAYTEAKAEVKEAADSKDGLFELPLANSKDATAVSRGGPLGYSETSPYVWQDLQEAAGRGEDRSGSGT